MGRSPVPGRSPSRQRSERRIQRPRGSVRRVPGPGTPSAPAAGPAVPQTGPVTSPTTVASPAAPPPRAVRRRPARRWPLLLAVAAGLVLYAAFPPVGAWPLAPVGVALLVAGLPGAPAAPRRARRAALRAGAVPAAGRVDRRRSPGRRPGSRWRCSRRSSSLPLGAALALTARLPAWPLWAAALWVGQEALRVAAALRRLPVGPARLQPARHPVDPAGGPRRAPLPSASPWPSAARCCWPRSRPAAGRRRAARPRLRRRWRSSACGLLVPLPTSGDGRAPSRSCRATSRGSGWTPSPSAPRCCSNHVATTRALAADVDAGRRGPPRPGDLAGERLRPRPLHRSRRCAA